MSHLAHFSFFSLGVFSFWGLFFLAASTLLAAPHGSRHKLIESRTVTFHYQATIPPVKSGEGPVDFFIPIAQSDEFQDVLERTINSPVKGSLRKEEKYGNLYWHAHLKDTGGKPVPITIIYKIERKLHQQPELKTVADLSLSRKTLNRHALFLQPNERVPIDGPIIQKVRADLPKVKKNTPYYKARSIYDYVIDTMEYKKIGTGWGNGDTYWACSERYGNCTDFHALRSSRVASK